MPLFFLSGIYLDYVVDGLSYSDEDVQIAVCYICVNLYSTKNYKRTSSKMCTNILLILCETNNQTLIINALGMSPHGGGFDWFVMDRSL